MKLCEFLRRLTSTYKEWVATHASRTPAHDSIAAVAPFRAWRGSQLFIAGGPRWKCNISLGLLTHQANGDRK